MKKAWKIVIGFFLFFLILNRDPCQAKAESVAVYRAEFQERNLEIYVDNPGELQSVSVQIGSQVCDEVKASGLDSEDIPMNTYLLVDNSLSIPKECREFIKEIMRRLAAGRMSKETVTIATFDRELHVCAADSKNLDELNQAIDGITFQDLDTRIPDVLYSLYENLNAANPQGMVRIILFSDGMESSGIGYTKEEVNALVSESGYPIYMIGCKKDNNESELETMFRFARVSNGNYFLVDGTQDVQTIVDSMNTIFGGLKITAVLPYGMGDGSQKGVKVSFQTTDGEKTATFTQTMPFLEEPETEAESLTEAVTEATEATDAVTETAETMKTTEAAETEAAAEPVPEETSEAAPAGKETELSITERLLVPQVYLPAAGGFLLLVLCAVLAVVIRKKKREKKAWENEEERTEVLNESGEKTEIIEEDDDKTTFAEAFVTIQLRDLKNPARIFEFPLENSVVVGRKASESQVVIDYDRSVSAMHCEFFRMNGKIYIRDLDSSNGTEIGDKGPICEDTELASGDVVKLGRLQFEVNIF